MNILNQVARFILLSICLIAFAACAGAGRKWDTTHANQVQNGVHDKEEIQAWFVRRGCGS